VTELFITDIAPDTPAMEDDVGPLIRMLRPGLTGNACAEFVGEAHRQGLAFTAAYDPAGRCVGVAAHRVLATSRGRLLFLDDLITHPDLRSSGVGSQLMAELEARARKSGCTRIELDSGVTNDGAHRFYHARGMSIVAHHFSLEV
jgi:GNAT superfamily N-acetyltransferase